MELWHDIICRGGRFYQVNRCISTFRVATPEVPGRFRVIQLPPLGWGIHNVRRDPSQEFIIDVFSGPLWTENHSKGLFDFCHLGCRSVTKEQFAVTRCKEGDVLNYLTYIKQDVLLGPIPSSSTGFFFWMSICCQQVTVEITTEVRRNQDHLEVFQSPPRRQICRRGSWDLLA